MSHFVQDTVHDILSSNKYDNLWNYSIKILRLSLPVAFLITMTALKTSFHSEATHSQWQWKTSKRDEKHKCSF